MSGSFFAKLASLCSLPWQPLVFAGSHRCDLCQFDGPQFSANLFVPHGGRIYVAPVAITHYIAAHWYHPPDIFIRAVLECPAMSSMEYKKAILQMVAGVSPDHLDTIVLIPQEPNHVAPPIENRR